MGSWCKIWFVKNANYVVKKYMKITYVYMWTEIALMVVISVLMKMNANMRED